MAQHRILFAANTYFQLLVALHLMRSEFRGSVADVILTDHSADSEAVARRLEETGVFRSVFFVRDADGDGASFSAKCARYLRSRLFPRSALRGLAPLAEDYDLFLFNNPSLLSHLIALRYRRQADCYRFEEGFGTYTRPFLEKKALRAMLIRLAFGDLQRNLKGLYLFHPELYAQSAPCPILPMAAFPAGDAAWRELLNGIFDYRPDPLLTSASYIFMEESFRAEGLDVGDVELVRKLAELLGREKLVVKRHPRSPGNPFAGCGAAVSSAGSVPWEVIQMNLDCRDKTLLTVTSGSVLAGALYLEQPVQVRMLFRCLPGGSPMANAAYLSYLDRLCRLYPNIQIPEELDGVI